jgi:hypothetical protein
VASQDITQVIASPSQAAKEEQRSRKVLTRPALAGIPIQAQEEQHPLLVSAMDAPTALISTPAPDVPRKLPITVVPVRDVPVHRGVSDATTSVLKIAKQGDNWLWYALVLNLLICLLVAVEYAWQVGSAALAADTLLVVLPAILVGPLLALLFRRVSYRVPLWGLFWGVFFGLTDALASTLLCLVWGALIQLPLNFRCGTWCGAGDGFKVLFQVMLNLAAQALVPMVLGLWMAVIGGAIIGLVRLRQS